MTVPPKWLFGLFVLWVGLTMLCSIPLGVDLFSGSDAQAFGMLGTRDASVTSVADLYKIVTGIMFWGEADVVLSNGSVISGEAFSFFNDGIGYYIRLFLLALSAAILLPLIFDTVRLILPWKS